MDMNLELQLDGPTVIGHSQVPVGGQEAFPSRNLTASLFWTPETVVRLRELWDAGIVGSEIARQLGATRNMIMGKASRLNLTLRKPQPAPQRKANPVANLANDACRWPIGDPRDEDFHFCGAKPVTIRKDGKSRPYCGLHTPMAYLPPRVR